MDHQLLKKVHFFTVPVYLVLEGVAMLNVHPNKRYFTVCFQSQTIAEAQGLSVCLRLSFPVCSGRSFLISHTATATYQEAGNLLFRLISPRRQLQKNEKIWSQRTGTPPLKSSDGLN